MIIRPIYTTAYAEYECPIPGLITLVLFFILFISYKTTSTLNFKSCLIYIQMH